MATLLVNDVTPRVQYTATASQTTFAYPFAIFADADLKVYQTLSGASPDDDADILTLTTHYTVTGAGGTSGGNVVLVTGAASGDVITIERDLAVSRTTDYQNLGKFASESFNDDLDKFIMMVQQNESALATLVPLLSRSTQASGLTIEDPVSGNFLQYNATGTKIISGGDTSDIANAAANATAAAASAADASTSETNAAASAATINLPDITGNGLSYLRANAGETGQEYRTPAQVLSDIAAEAAQTAASQAEMEAGTEAALRSMSPLRIAQAIAALVPAAPAQKFTTYQVTSTSDTVLATGNNNAASFGTVTIPTAGLIRLHFTGRINNDAALNALGWGVKIGASYFYFKFDDNGVAAEGSDDQTANIRINASEYRILYGTGGADNANTNANISAALDIEALGITTGSNTVEFGIDAVNSATLKGTLVTSRFYMTIEDFT